MPPQQSFGGGASAASQPVVSQLRLGNVNHSPRRRSITDVLWQTKHKKALRLTISDCRLKTGGGRLPAVTGQPRAIAVLG